MTKGFGATGNFPKGRLNESDEGELQFGIAADHKRKLIILNFGKPIAWTGMPPETAREIAMCLLKKAGEVDGVVTEVQFGGDRTP